MQYEYQEKLETWGLTKAQAQVYLALLTHPGALGASAVAAVAGLPRPSVYSVLESLVDKGMVRTGEGYGSKFAALPPEDVLPALMAAERERVTERELLTDDLVKSLPLLAGTKRKSPRSELVEILRDPRAVEEGFRAFQREARAEVLTFVRGPFVLNKLNRKGNPAEEESLSRGVKHRAIYESALLADENVAPFLQGWIASGEDARAFDGELPLKLVLFDDRVVWLPLETNASRHPVVTIVIRHPALNAALRLLFEYLWEESKPITFKGERAAGKARNGAKLRPKSTNSLRE